jgi:hypothetical protein
MTESIAGSGGRHVLDFANEFWGFLRVRKKFWLLPIVVIMGLFGAVVVLTKGTVVAPFIYVLF